MEGIRAIGPVGPAEIGSSPEIKSQQSSESFGKLLSDALEQVNKTQAAAERAAADLAAGKTTDIHNVMIATEKASLAIQLTVQVRNKVVEAYQEIMRMQV